MEEKTIKINTNIFLSDVVSSIQKGEWKIPRFQREFVWEKKKVIELLYTCIKDSLLQLLSLDSRKGREYSSSD